MKLPKTCIEGIFGMLAENQLQTGDATLPKLRNWLSSANLSEGDRIPPERVLAEALQVSRADLRKALLVLESEGHLDRQVGRGTFVRDPNRVGLADAAKLALLAQKTGPHEAMIARLALEPELARLAALHASPNQIAEMRRLADAMRTSPDWETYEELDSRFHDMIAEATGNPLLQEISRIVNGVRRQVVWSRLYLPEGRPNPDYHSFAEHDEIVAALERRDRAGSRDAMRRHINSTLGTMMADD